MISLAAAVALVRADPLDPDAADARRWVQEELSNPRYRAGEPNAFDRAMQAVRDWFLGLLDGAGAVSGEVIALLIVLGVVVLLVIGLLVFGVPRLRRRRRVDPATFEDDRRDAATIRRAAESAARSADWALAIEERFRALVRDLVVRELVQVYPGSTARALADAAARPFPAFAAQLASAAVDFDAVRYLDRPGDADAYAGITALDGELQSTRPALDGAALLDAPLSGMTPIGVPDPTEAGR